MHLSALSLSVLSQFFHLPEPVLPVCVVVSRERLVPDDGNSDSVACSDSQSKTAAVYQNGALNVDSHLVPSVSTIGRIQLEKVILRLGDCREWSDTQTSPERQRSAAVRRAFLFDQYITKLQRMTRERFGLSQ